jgi:hypothetical protein
MKPEEQAPPISEKVFWLALRLLGLTLGVVSFIIWLITK